MLFAGRFIDWMGTKKGYLWSIGIWSAGACLHAFCGIITEEYVGMHSAAELIAATGDVVVVLATISMYCFLVARCILALGEAGIKNGSCVSSVFFREIFGGNFNGSRKIAGFTEC